MNLPELTRLWGRSAWRGPQRGAPNAGSPTRLRVGDPVAAAALGPRRGTRVGGPQRDA